MVQQINEFPDDFMQAYLGLVAQYFPGETTLNQIRILQHISMLSKSNAGHGSNSEICNVLGLSAATVSRAVSSFIGAGILSEEEDPRDGRKRLIKISDSYLLRGGLDQKALELARRYFRGKKAVSEMK